MPPADGRGIDQVDAVPSDSPSPALPNSLYDLVTHAAGDLPDAIARGHLVRYARTPLSMPGTPVGPGSP